jgi:hypothetical protein
MRELIKQILNEQTEHIFLREVIVNYFIKQLIPISSVVIGLKVSPQTVVTDNGELKRTLKADFKPKQNPISLDRKKIELDLSFSKKEIEIFDNISDDELIGSLGNKIGYDINKPQDLIMLLDYNGTPIMFYENNAFYLTTPNMDFGEWTSARGHVWLRSEKVSLKITNLSNLYHTKGNFGIYDINLNEFGGMSKHDGNLGINYSQVKNWDTLTYIGGNLTIYELSTVSSLGNLKHVGNNLDIRGNVFDTGNLEYIGGDLIINNNTLVSLGKIKKINGRLRIRGSVINDLGDLQEVTGGALVSKDISPELLNEFKVRGIKIKKG